MFLPARHTLLLLLVMTALLSAGCSEDGEPPVGNRQTTDPAAGSVAILGVHSGDFEIRKPGEVAYQTWKGEMYLEGGTSIRAKESIVSLTFMGSDQVQLGEVMKISELILEGPVETRQGRMNVLGLKSGLVWVNASADHPIVVRLPHGEVSGLRAYFGVDLKRVRDGGYVAEVKAFSTNNVTVRNEHGSILVPHFATVRMDETEPPKIMKKLIPHRKQ